MAKHAHRLMLNQKKTWRCTLPNCSYFIHIGLAHILPGKQSVCWECGEEFTLSERALKDDQPICDECNARKHGMPDDMGDYINTKIALTKAGIKHTSQLTPEKIQALLMVGAITDAGLKRVRELEQSESSSDQVEVIEPNEE